MRVSHIVYSILDSVMLMTFSQYGFIFVPISVIILQLVYKLIDDNVDRVYLFVRINLLSLLNSLFLF